MQRLVLLAAIVTSMMSAPAQPVPRMSAPEAIRLLTFEDAHVGGPPKGWFGGPPETIAVDDKVVHGEKWVRMTRDPGLKKGFSAVTRSIPVDFAGQTIELR